MPNTGFGSTSKHRALSREAGAGGGRPRRAAAAAAAPPAGEAEGEQRAGKRPRTGEALPSAAAALAGDAAGSLRVVAAAAPSRTQPAALHAAAGELAALSPLFQGPSPPPPSAAPAPAARAPSPPAGPPVQLRLLPSEESRLPRLPRPLWTVQLRFSRANLLDLLAGQLRQLCAHRCAQLIRRTSAARWPSSWTAQARASSARCFTPPK